MIHKKKKELRKKVQELRDAIDLEQRKALSAHVAENLWSIPEFAAAKTVLFFISFRSEVDTVPMIRRALGEGKRVLLPYTIPDNREMVASEVLDFDADLELGNYDIMEPREESVRPVLPGDIDVIVMPGVAFDRDGRRLGYGGGYYDRFLDRCEPRCLRVAPCFDLQVVEEVPSADHDHRVHVIVTERRIIDCGGRAV